jgi:hypothetical protein
MFCAPVLVFDGTEGVGSRFYVLCDRTPSEVPRASGSIFNVLHARTHFRRDRGRGVPFSCFALPDSFSALPRASVPVFMFCAPVHIFGGIEGVGSRLHVLRSRTCFRRYRARGVPFSCFALPDLFSTVPRALNPVFMFCPPGFVFGGTEGVGSRFHVLCSRTRFRRYRGRRSRFHVLRSRSHFQRYRGIQVLISCFALPNLFWEVPRASGPVFMFAHVHVLPTWTRFCRYRGRRVSFSCFSLPDLFSVVPRASGPISMFCAPRLIFGVTEGDGSRFHVLRPGLIFGSTKGVRSRFHVLRAPTHFRLNRGRRFPFSFFALHDSFSAIPRASVPVFLFCTPVLVFGGNEGVMSHFHVLPSRTHFQWWRGRRVPFSCFALLDSFSAVPRVSGPVFMFSAAGLIFGGTEGGKEGGTEGVGSRFHVLRALTHFLRNQGRQVPFSCFALPYSFSVVPRASGPVFMFCSPRLFFSGNDGVGSRFHVLRAPTRFRRYRRRRVPFSCFALPDSFSAVPKASGPVFMFCPPGLVFGGTEDVGSRFHVLPSRTRFRRCRGH